MGRRFLRWKNGMRRCGDAVDAFEISHGVDGVVMENRKKTTSAVAQNKAERRDFTWAILAEVHGFGAGPNKRFSRILSGDKIVKTSKCGHTCPACRFVMRAN